MSKEVTMPRRMLALVLAVALLWVVAPAAAQGPTPEAQPGPWEHKVSSHVRAAVASGRAEFLVVLAEQADLRGADALPTRAAKAQFVYQQLRDTAERTQPPLV